MKTKFRLKTEWNHETLKIRYSIEERVLGMWFDSVFFYNNKTDAEKILKERLNEECWKNHPPKSK